MLYGLSFATFHGQLTMSILGRCLQQHYDSGKLHQLHALRCCQDHVKSSDPQNNTKHAKMVQLANILVQNLPKMEKADVLDPKANTRQHLASCMLYT